MVTCLSYRYNTSTIPMRAGQGISLSIGRFIRPNAGRYMISGAIGFSGHLPF